VTADQPAPPRPELGRHPQQFRHIAVVRMPEGVAATGHLLRGQRVVRAQRACHRLGLAGRLEPAREQQSPDRRIRHRIRTRQQVPLAAPAKLDAGAAGGGEKRQAGPQNPGSVPLAALILGDPKGDQPSVALRRDRVPEPDQPRAAPQHDQPFRPEGTVKQRDVAEPVEVGRILGHDLPPELKQRTERSRLEGRLSHTIHQRLVSAGQPRDPRALVNYLHKSRQRGSYVTNSTR
jgi:hypothetical protein